MESYFQNCKDQSLNFQSLNAKQAFTQKPKTEPAGWHDNRIGTDPNNPNLPLTKFDYMLFALDAKFGDPYFEQQLTKFPPPSKGGPTIVEDTGYRPSSNNGPGQTGHCEGTWGKFLVPGEEIGRNILGFMQDQLNEEKRAGQTRPETLGNINDHLQKTKHIDHNIIAAKKAIVQKMATPPSFASLQPQHHLSGSPIRPTVTVLQNAAPPTTSTRTTGHDSHIDKNR